MNESPSDAIEAVADAGWARARSVVPDVIGLSLADACESAAWAGTSVSATSVERARGPWGLVVAQSPAPGTHMKEMWQVHVLVSVPPPPEPDQGS